MDDSSVTAREPPTFDVDGVIARFSSDSREFPRDEVAACVDDPALGRAVVRAAIDQAIEQAASPPNEAPIFFAWPIAGALADPELLPDVLRFLEVDHEAIELSLGDASNEIGDEVVYAIGRARPEDLERALERSRERPTAARMIGGALARMVLRDGYDGARVRASILPILDAWERDGFPEDSSPFERLELAYSLGYLGYVDDHERLARIAEETDTFEDELPYLPRDPALDPADYQRRAREAAREELASHHPVDPFFLASWPHFRAHEPRLRAEAPQPPRSKPTVTSEARKKKKALRKQKKKSRRRR